LLARIERGARRMREVPVLGLRQDLRFVNEEHQHPAAAVELLQHSGQRRRRRSLFADQGGFHGRLAQARQLAGRLDALDRRIQVAPEAPQKVGRDRPADGCDQG